MSTADAAVASVQRRWRSTRAFGTRVGPRARDVVAVLMALTAGFGYAASESDRSAAWVVALVAMAVVSAAAMWWRRSHPIPVIVVSLAEAVLTDVPVALAIAVVTLTIRRRDRLLAGVLALVYVVDIVHTLATGMGVFTTLASSTLFWAAVLGLGAFVGARRDLVESLRQRAETAEAERELRTEQARLGERHRIAGEMHDVLAHKVSLIALHAGALEVTAAADAAQVERTAAVLRTTAREAMEDLRRVLGVLRTDDTGVADLAPQPGLAEVARLVAASRQAGVPITSADTVHGVPPDVLGRTAHRIVQEALTNVHKHARSAATAVQLDGRAGDALTVRVRNQAPVSAGTLLPGAGLGLVGLAERVALAGGHLDAGPTPDGGWQVLARLPWPDGQTDGASGGTA